MFITLIEPHVPTGQVLSRQILVCLAKSPLVAAHSWEGAV